MPHTVANILAVDPGPEQSAYVVFDGSGVVDCGMSGNDLLLSWIYPRGNIFPLTELLAIEAIESFGMPVGREVFETVFWTGRFAQAWHERSGEFARLGRKQCKLHLCGSARAKDANVRQALIDKFGGSRQTAVGTKKKPGPL